LFSFATAAGSAVALAARGKPRRHRHARKQREQHRRQISFPVHINPPALKATPAKDDPPQQAFRLYMSRLRRQCIYRPVMRHKPKKFLKEYKNLLTLYKQ
jgi:hypothetical protein